MSDPLEHLRRFDTEGLDVNPLPASEVRRRGNRMRRRNNAIAVVGGLAAVALIAVPLAITAGGSDHASVPPAGQGPSRTAEPVDTAWVQEIPESFPLTRGMPATNGDDGSPVRAQPGYDAQAPVAPCGSQPWDTETPVPASDVEQAIYTGESEGGEERVLALYADQDAAVEALNAIRGPLAQGCAVPRHGIEYAEVPSDLGEESLVYVDRYRDRGEPTGEAFLHQVVRTGNALLLVSTYFGGAGDDAVVDHTARLVRTKTASTVSSMCVFAAEPCDPLPTAPTSTVPGGTGEGAVSAIPDDFPILDGYPDDSSSEGGDYGISGPTHDAKDLAFEGCGTRAADPDGVEQLSGGWTNPEDFRHRQLTTFATTAAADAYVDQVLQVYRDCPTQVGQDDYTALRTVLDGDQGDRSASAIVRYELNGGMAPGLDITTVVRVGRAVLLATTYNEGTASTDQELADAAARDADAVTTLVDAMCPWTEQGC